MKFFIKRNIDDSNRAFTVFDEKGCEKYFAIFTKTKFPVVLEIVDSNFSHIAKIRQFPVMDTSTFVIKTGKKHMTLTVVAGKCGLNCFFYGSNWLIRGNPGAKNFYIIDVDNTVISNHKKHADYYELDIHSSTNEIYCLATSICIDLINTVDNLAIQVV